MKRFDIHSNAKKGNTVRKNSLGKRVMSYVLAGAMLAGSVPADSITVLGSDFLLYSGSDEQGGFAGAGSGEVSGGGDSLMYSGSDAQTYDAVQMDTADPGGNLAFSSGGVENPDAWIIQDDQEERILEEPDMSTDDFADVYLDDEAGETVAIVSSASGTNEFDSFSKAWDAAASAAAADGSAVMELAADWASDNTGRFGNGYNFSNEGSLVVDVPGGEITIRGNGHKIIGKGAAKTGGCVIGVFDGSLVIKDVQISGGNSTMDGGGILVLGGKVTLDHAVLKDNAAGTGGGMCITGGAAIVKDSEITGNSAQNRGGGIFVNTDTASLTLEGTVKVTGNNAVTSPDICAIGNGTINTEKLTENSLAETGTASNEDLLKEEETTSDTKLLTGDDPVMEDENPAEEEPGEATVEEPVEEPGEESGEATMEEPGEESGEQSTVAAGIARTITDSVILRAQATTESEMVTMIAETGTEMIMLGKVISGEEVWIQVQLGDLTGYIRSDLLEVEETAPAQEEEETAGEEEEGEEADEYTDDIQAAETGTEQEEDEMIVEEQPAEEPALEEDKDEAVEEEEEADSIPEQLEDGTGRRGLLGVPLVGASGGPSRGGAGLDGLVEYDENAVVEGVTDSSNMSLEQLRYITKITNGDSSQQNFRGAWVSPNLKYYGNNDKNVHYGNADVFWGWGDSTHKVNVYSAGNPDYILSAFDTVRLDQYDVFNLDGQGMYCRYSVEEPTPGSGRNDSTIVYNSVISDVGENSNKTSCHFIIAPPVGSFRAGGFKGTVDSSNKTITAEVPANMIGKDAAIDYIFDIEKVEQFYDRMAILNYLDVSFVTALVPKESEVSIDDLAYETSNDSYTYKQNIRLSEQMTLKVYCIPVSTNVEAISEKKILIDEWSVNFVSYGKDVVKYDENTEVKGIADNSGMSLEQLRYITKITNGAPSQKNFRGAWVSPNLNYYGNNDKNVHYGNADVFWGWGDSTHKVNVYSAGNPNYDIFGSPCEHYEQFDVFPLDGVGTHICFLVNEGTPGAFPNYSSIEYDSVYRSVGGNSGETDCHFIIAPPVASFRAGGSEGNVDWNNKTITAEVPAEILGKDAAEIEYTFDIGQVRPFYDRDGFDSRNYGDVSFATALVPKGSQASVNDFVYESADGSYTYKQNKPLRGQMTLQVYCIPNETNVAAIKGKAILIDEWDVTFEPVKVVLDTLDIDVNGLMANESFPEKFISAFARYSGFADTDLYDKYKYDLAKLDDVQLTFDSEDLLVQRRKQYTASLKIPYLEDNRYDFADSSKLQVKIHIHKEESIDTLSSQNAEDKVSVKSVFPGGVNISFPMIDNSVNDVQDITGEIQWVDDNNRAGVRPTDVSVRLLQDGATIKSAEVDRNSWYFEFKEVPVSFANTQLFEYSVSQNPIPNYTTVIEKMNILGPDNREHPHFVIRNTYAPQRTILSGSINWVDGEDAARNRPRSVTVTVVDRDGNSVPGASQVTVRKEDGWNFTLDVPGFNTSDMQITLSDLPSYYTQDSVVSGDRVTLTSTLNAVKPIRVKIVWKDSRHREARPDNVKIVLNGNNVEIISKTVRSADFAGKDEWTAVFENVPTVSYGRELQYNVSESAIENYDIEVAPSAASDADFVVTNTWKADNTKDMSVCKVWNDDNNAQGARPYLVEVEVRQNGDVFREVQLAENIGWKELLNDLPVSGTDSFGNTVQYTYTVTEKNVKKANEDGTVPEDAGDYFYNVVEEDGIFTVTNTLTPHPKKVSFKVRWDDKDNQDGKRPGMNDIRFTLLANGKSAGSVQAAVSEGPDANTWTLDFGPLPSYDGSGKKITYTLAPAETEGYTIGTTEDGLRYSHAPEMRSINVSVKWEDNENQDGMRPESVTVALYEDGRQGTAAVGTLPLNNSWTYTFESLPKYRNGMEIRYTADEPAVPAGYTQRSTGGVADGFTITNTHTLKQRTVKVQVQWEDSDNASGKRPNEVTVQLMADGKLVEDGEVTVKGSGWTKDYVNLPMFQAGKEIDYTVEQKYLDDYETKVAYDRAGGNSDELIVTVTNTYKADSNEKTIKVTKAWKKGDGTEIESGTSDYDTLPASVQVYLTENGKRTKMLTLEKNKGYTGYFENLPVIKNGESVTYSVEEPYPPAGYQAAVSQKADTTEKINDAEVTVTPFEVTNTQKAPDGVFRVRVLWEGDNEEARPKTVTVQVMANGERSVFRFISASSGTGWSYDFTGLPDVLDGVPQLYTVMQGSLPNYATTYEKTEDGYIIRNKWLANTCSLSVGASWEDNRNADSTRPQSVTVYLVKNGAVTNQSITLTAPQYVGSLTGLPLMEDGKQIKYSVTEKASDIPRGYTFKVEETGAENVMTIVHTLKAQEKTDVTLTVKWEDASNQDNMRPADASFTLVGNGKEIETRTVSGTAWDFTFSNVNKNENGKPVDYTVIPADLSALGYESSISEPTNNKIIVTYTRAPETESMRITKEWKDENNQDCLRPSSLKVKALCNGSMIARDGKTLTENEEEAWTVTLNEGNNWAAVFDGLPRYVPGKVGVAASWTFAEIWQDLSQEKAYTANISGTKIINIHEIQKKEIQGSITWKNETAAASRPEKVTLRLLANGKDAFVQEYKGPI